MANDQNDQMTYIKKHQDDLEKMFMEVLGNDHVYFQPPESVKLKYECIVYSRVNVKPAFAGNSPYKTDRRYIATIISTDPDTTTPDKLALKECCTQDRAFASDGLYHYVFTVY